MVINMSKTSWEELTRAAVIGNGETINDIQYKTLNDSDFKREFDGSPGSSDDFPDHTPFYAYTENNVYFSCQSQNMFLVDSVSRNPGVGPDRHR